MYLKFSKSNTNGKCAKSFQENNTFFHRLETFENAIKLYDFIYKIKL